jgi:hypothetical protein
LLTKKVGQGNEHFGTWCMGAHLMVLWFYGFLSFFFFL